ncbi:MAG TPA: hypothetical protein VFU19_06395 [Iamia sp.]|nr:hypothetical protein [Iamia sp.]
MTDEPAARPSATDVLGPSAAVETLGIVVIGWAVADRRPLALVAGIALCVGAAAGIGAGLGRPRHRTRRGAALGLGAGLALAVLAVGALVVQARSVGVGGPAADVEGRFEAAWAAGDAVVGATYDTVRVIGDDGTVGGGGEAATGRHVVLPSGGAATVDDGGDVVIRGDDGALVWRTTLTVDGRPTERLDVVAADAEDAAVVHACVEGRCDLVGIGADGREAWRRMVPETTGVGSGPVVVDVPGEPALREAPTRLVVVDEPEAGDARAVEVDVVTGAEADLAPAGEVAVVGDVVTIARVRPDGCEVGIVRGGADEEVVDVPCAGDRFATATPIGTWVVHRQWGTVVAVDVTDGTVATTEVGTDHRVAFAGEGVLVEQDARRVVVRDLGDDAVLATHAGWDLVAGGRDGVVMERERESGNPFVPERLVEVAVVDPASGEVCARVRLDTPLVSGASPLPGCRAVVTPANGASVLVG